MTARDLLYARTGLLRAPWRLAGFGLVTAVAIRVAAMPLYAFVRFAVPPGQMRQLLAYEVSYLAILAGALAGHVVMLRWVDRLPWSTVGLGRGQLRPAPIGLALGAACIGAPSAVLLAVHWLQLQPGSAYNVGWFGFAAAGAVFFLPQSFAEELIARGYPFAVLRDLRGWPLALLLTSLVFGAAHLRNPNSSFEPVMIVVFAGVFLGGILVVTGSLYAAWMAHFAWNWTMSAILHAPVSGVGVPVPGYKLIDTGPDWMTGGPWGPEGGVGAAIGMAAGLALLIALHRRTQPAPSSIIGDAVHGVGDV